MPRLDRGYIFLNLWEIYFQNGPQNSLLQLLRLRAVFTFAFSIASFAFNFRSAVLLNFIQVLDHLLLQQFEGLPHRLFSGLDPSCQSGVIELVKFLVLPTDEVAKGRGKISDVLLDGGSWILAFVADSDIFMERHQQGEER